MSLIAILVTLAILAYFFKPRMSRKEYYHKIYLKSDHWHTVRNAVGDRAGWQCEVKGCNRFGKGLNCHHLNYRSVGHERMSDLVYVCPRHHSLLHSGISLTTWKGRIIPAFSYRQ